MGGGESESFVVITTSRGKETSRPTAFNLDVNDVGVVLTPKMSQPLSPVGDDTSPTTCRERYTKNTYLSIYRGLLLSLHPSSLTASNPNKENDKDIDILEENTFDFGSFVERHPLHPPRLITNYWGSSQLLHVQDMGWPPTSRDVPALS